MPEIQKRLHDLTKEIDGYTQAILTGEAVELDGMDERVAHICTEIEKLPPEEAVIHSDDLQQMIAALDHLVVAIKNNPESFE